MSATEVQTNSLSPCLPLFFSPSLSLTLSLFPPAPLSLSLSVSILFLWETLRSGPAPFRDKKGREGTVPASVARGVTLP